VVAYADDVPILIITPDDITVVNDAIRCLEKATGAMLNITKSQVLVVSTWDTSRKVLDIQYSDVIKVLGFRLKNSIAQSGISSCARITNTFRSQARDAYSGYVDMVQRIQCVHVYLLAKLWHTEQISPLPQECVQQIVTAMTCYIWNSVIFRIPVSTLQRRKDEGLEPDRCSLKMSSTPADEALDSRPT
jgi:hypothetical protein